jgi:ribonuclease P protein component
MLSSKLRVKRVDFKNKKEKSGFFHSPFVLLSVYRNDSNQISKFSFSISKKNIKSAVKRNLLRRRGYSVIEKNLKNIKPGFIFMFSFKKEALDLSFDQLADSLIKLIQLAKLLN